MTLPRKTVCDWCELDIEDRDRPVRLSTSQPPWTIRSGASAIAAVGFSFAASLRAITDELDVTLWFHRPCWSKFYALLRDGR